MNTVNDRILLTCQICSARVPKAAEDSRTPTPCGNRGPRESAPASWSAAVLCRFFFRSLAGQIEQHLRKNVLLFAAFLSVFAVVGCKSFRPVDDLIRYYVLSGTTTSSTGGVHSSQGPTIGLAPVNIPGYLQNTRIAVRTGTNEVDYSEQRQWAEHLAKGIQRVLASDLSTVLPSTRVITSAWQNDDVKAEVHISIQRFELDETGEATLECEWRLLSPTDGHVLHLDHSLITKKGPPLGKNATGAVNTLSQTVAELSNQIAAALKTSG
jgi:uncharacterized lipoprotein YmbA